MNPEPNSEQIPLGPLVATVGAIVVIVSLCLDWYEQITGFTVFEFLDLLLVGLALVAVASLLSAFGAFRAIDVSPGRSLAAGAAALILVVSQILNDPPAAAGAAGPSKDIGIWLALAGSALMLGGAVLGYARISLAVEARRRPGAPAPGPDRDEPPERP